MGREARELGDRCEGGRAGGVWSVRRVGLAGEEGYRETGRLRGEGAVGRRWGY